MSMFDNVKNKATELNEQHGEKIEEHSDTGLDKAGELAESKGASAEHVEKGRAAADERIGNE